MSLNNPIPGPQYGAEFNVSAVPFVTSSVASGVKRIRFSYLTKFVKVKNDTNAELHVGFTENGLTKTNNYYSLDQNESFEAEIRVTELWLSGSGNSYQMVAGLTGISDRHIAQLTGSNGFPGVG